PFDGVEGNRSDFTVAASRFGVDINHLGGRKDVKAKLEADFWVDSGKGDGKLRIRHAYVSFDDWL
ncbi:MAG TPA: porin, partial [Acinetobacter radioresistens]|nr:porin [Acinetobacter radioresistens]